MARAFENCNVGADEQEGQAVPHMQVRHQVGDLPGHRHMLRLDGYVMDDQRCPNDSGRAIHSHWRCLREN